jgi:transposase
VTTRSITSRSRGLRVAARRRISTNSAAAGRHVAVVNPARVKYAGLAPREFRSGSSVRPRTRPSKAGNARLRKALFLPTLTAIRFNPVLRAFFDRLVRAGKPRMAAIGACMHKLLMICYGVLRTRTPFDPRWSAKKTT